MAADDQGSEYISAECTAPQEIQGGQIRTRPLRQCPYCDEDVSLRAVKCPHCHSALVEKPRRSSVVFSILCYSIFLAGCWILAKILAWVAVICFILYLVVR